ncbi:MAG: gamma-glutamylcyclotransferase [Alphaproteobacteria bacterium]|nr:MAG: gamma-glutamylcyclotransferase [Alphaproteobacteria bacterium]
MRFFFYGLLADRDVLELVLGRPVTDWPPPRAKLPGYRLARLRGETFPVLVPASGSHVPGIVVDDLSKADVDRILFFESVEYAPTPVTVILEEGDRPLGAQAFLPTARGSLDDTPWRLEDWQARHKPAALEEAALWMALYGHLGAAEADRLWDEAVARGRSIADMVAEITARRSRTRR